MIEAILGVLVGFIAGFGTCYLGVLKGIISPKEL